MPQQRRPDHRNETPLRPQVTGWPLLRAILTDIQFWIPALALLLGVLFLAYLH